MLVAEFPEKSRLHSFSLKADLFHERGLRLSCIGIIQLKEMIPVSLKKIRRMVQETDGQMLRLRQFRKPEVK